jgi:hypothetical protein
MPAVLPQAIGRQNGVIVKSLIPQVGFSSTSRYTDFGGDYPEPVLEV